VPLPHEHGFPLRIIIPHRYGMKQPKWILRMELIDREGEGYWVERGWSAEAFVRTTSVIDPIVRSALDEASGLLPIGGIGYAGAAGISRIEAQVDDGPWVEAQLRAPALSGLTWVQWRYDWPAVPGRHTFRVRAVDAQGVPQIETREGVRPDGATGLHVRTATI
jgi:DMSO/TMAO reductase YedYZ molybdopterin-dependent catalytic subunit